MVSPSRGGVVLVKFPFSDLSASKVRPALILAHAGKDDWILCQITSNPYSDARAIEIDAGRFESGGLHQSSYVRPGKLFTADVSVMHRPVGQLTSEALGIVVQAVIALLEDDRR